MACGQQQAPEAVSNDTSSKTATTQIAAIEISNPSEFARTQQPLYLSYHDLGLTAEQANALVARVNNSLVPAQHIDRSGDGAART